MSQRIKYSKELLEEAAANSQSIAGVPRYLSLKQTGGNQTHIARRLRDYGVNIQHFTGCGHNKGKAGPTKKSAEEILVMSPPGSYRPKRFLPQRALWNVAWRKFVKSAVLELSGTASNSCCTETILMGTG